MRIKTGSEFLKQFIVEDDPWAFYSPSPWSYVHDNSIVGTVITTSSTTSDISTDVADASCLPKK